MSSNNEQPTHQFKFNAEAPAFVPFSPNPVKQTGLNPAVPEYIPPAGHFPLQFPFASAVNPYHLNLNVPGGFPGVPPLHHHSYPAKMNNKRTHGNPHTPAPPPVPVPVPTLPSGIPLAALKPNPPTPEIPKPFIPLSSPNLHHAPTIPLSSPSLSPLPPANVSSSPKPDAPSAQRKEEKRRIENAPLRDSSKFKEKKSEEPSKLPPQADNVDSSTTKAVSVQSSSKATPQNAADVDSKPVTVEKKVAKETPAKVVAEEKKAPFSPLAAPVDKKSPAIAAVEKKSPVAAPIDKTSPVAAPVDKKAAAPVVEKKTAPVETKTAVAAAPVAVEKALSPKAAPVEKKTPVSPLLESKKAPRSPVVAPIEPKQEEVKEENKKTAKKDTPLPTATVLPASTPTPSTAAVEASTVAPNVAETAAPVTESSDAAKEEVKVVPEAAPATLSYAAILRTAHVKPAPVAAPVAPVAAPVTLPAAATETKAKSAATPAKNDAKTPTAKDERRGDKTTRQNERQNRNAERKERPERNAKAGNKEDSRKQRGKKDDRKEAVEASKAAEEPKSTPTNNSAPGVISWAQIAKPAAKAAPKVEAAAPVSKVDTPATAETVPVKVDAVVPEEPAAVVAETVDETPVEKKVEEEVAEVPVVASPKKEVASKPIEVEPVSIAVESPAAVSPKITPVEKRVESPCKKATQPICEPVALTLPEPVEPVTEKKEEEIPQVESAADEEDEDDRPPALSAQFVAEAEEQVAIASNQSFSLELLLSYRNKPECLCPPANHTIPPMLLKSDSRPSDRRMHPKMNMSLSSRTNRSHHGKKPMMGRNRDDGEDASYAVDPNLPPLISSANSWMCAVAKKSLDEREQTSRAMRSILNKLSIEKFDSLYKKLIDLNLSDKDHLSDLTQLIFEKAISQHHFIEMYAELCRKLKEGLTESSDIFRELLLQYLQEYFENTTLNGTAAYQERKEELEGAMDEDEQLETYFKAKKRALGNVRFVAALIIRKMVPVGILKLVCNNLLEKNTEEHIEYLVSFLTIMGSTHDVSRKGRDLSSVFNELERLVEGPRKEGEKDIGQRAKCLIKDLFDLKNNNWVTKKADQKGPKTIEEIRQDADKENQEKLIQSQKNAEMVKRGGMGGGFKGNTYSGGNTSSNTVSTRKTLNEKESVDECMSIINNSSGKDLNSMCDQFAKLNIDKTYYKPMFLAMIFKCIKVDKRRRIDMFDFMATLAIKSGALASAMRTALFDFLYDHYEVEREEFPKLGDVIENDLLNAFYDIDKDDLVFDSSETKKIRNLISGNDKRYSDSESSYDSYSEKEQDQE